MLEIDRDYYKIRCLFDRAGRQIRQRSGQFIGDSHANLRVRMQRV